MNFYGMLCCGYELAQHMLIEGVTAAIHVAPVSNGNGASHVHK